MSQAKLSGGWSLLRGSFGAWRQNFKTLTLVTLAVALPANLIQLVVPATDSSLSAYISLAAIIMNLAVIWTVVQIESGHKVKVSQAYYQGTASFVRFLLVSLILIVELIPAALGLLLYNVGVIGAAPGTTNFEKGFVGLLVLLLATPTVWMINRSLLAMVVTPSTDLAPIAAIKQSWRSVKGRSWQVLRRFGSLILAIILIVAIPSIALVYGFERTANRGFLALLQLLISVTILPLLNFYLYKLYRELAP